jgi:hypothetical protein
MPAHAAAPGDRVAAQVTDAPVTDLAGLSGTGKLADDLWLLAHDDRTGRPLLAGRQLGLGLAGALLAELAAVSYIRVTAQRVTVSGPLPGPADPAAGRPRERPPPADPLAKETLERLGREAGVYTPAEWLAYLGQDADADVAGRLTKAGYLARVPPRLWRRAGRVAPVDPDAAFAPMYRAAAALDSARELPAASGQLAAPGLARTLTPEGITLTALAIACGLDGRLRSYVRAGRRRSAGEVSGLLAQEDLRVLVAQVNAAVSSAVLTRGI